jgi:hypothetical protein
MRFPVFRGKFFVDSRKRAAMVPGGHRTSVGAGHRILLEAKLIHQQNFYAILKKYLDDKD